MAWTAPRDWTNGEIVTQTMLNTDVRDNMKEVWRRLAYVEFTANVTLAGANDATATTIVSSGALTYTAEPIYVEFYAPLYADPGNASAGLNLWDGATDLGRIVQSPGSLSVYFAPFERRHLTPTAASHTYMVKGWSSSSTAVVHAGAGGVATKMPGYIAVWQKGGA